MAHKGYSRIKTVERLLDGYGSLSVKSLLAPLADNFQHRVLPESLGMPPRDKAAFSKHATGVFSIFDRFQMIPRAINEDIVGNMVIIHAHMQGTLKNGGGEWKNECVMMIRLSADGLKVVEIAEFVDSAKAVEMRQKHAPKNFDGSKWAARASSMRPVKGSVGRLVLGMDQFIVVCFLCHIVQVVTLWMFGLHYQIAL